MLFLKGTFLTYYLELGLVSRLERGHYGKLKFNINNDIFNFVHNKKRLLPEKIRTV